MVRIIEASKSAGPSQADFDIQSFFKGLNAYMGQKGAVVVRKPKQTYLAGGSLTNKTQESLTMGSYELKGLGNVDVRIHELSSPEKNTFVDAEVKISGSDTLKNSMVPGNIKNIFQWNGFAVKKEDEINDEELESIKSY
jgi:hypothetical protein